VDRPRRAVKVERRRHHLGDRVGERAIVARL
jgi:hypothetical protein